MANMEIFIVLVSLAAAAGGSLVLLACMAGKRAQLVKAYNIKKEREQIEANLQQQAQSTGEPGQENSATPALS